MPTLQIRDVPDHIMAALKEQAAKERRTLTQQAIIVLEQGLSFQMDRYQRRLTMLEGITQFRENYQEWATLDAAELIREDRDA